MILLATLTTLVPSSFSAAAQAWLWLVDRDTFQPLHLVRDVVVAALAFTYSVWAIAGAGDDIVTKGFILLLAGIPVYIGMRWWDRRKLEHVTGPRAGGGEGGRRCALRPPRGSTSGRRSARCDVSSSTGPTSSSSA